jgi:hypothetical protein
VSQFVNLNTILSSVSSWTSICGSFRLLAIGQFTTPSVNTSTIQYGSRMAQREKTVQTPVGTDSKVLAVTRR